MTGKPSLKCLMMAFLMLLNCTWLFAQERVVTGKIKDPQGNPLPGVNVNVWGSRISVTADVSGTFRIPVSSENSVLVFSFVGFLQKEVKVGTDSTFSVTMTYDNADLDQVVVVGYGTSKRRDLTGSVYSVKPGMVTATPTFNALEALQGRVPGLDITRSSGAAGAGVNIQLRGNRTFSGTDRGVTGGQSSPLFIIDGFQTGSITDLNPSDIESVEVLKDASATAIYGWMGANGVIIVTTKKGKDRPKVSYNGFYGVNGYASYPKSRMGDDYIQLRREAWKNGGTGWASPADDGKLFTLVNGELAAWQAGQWVDWQDLITRNGIQQSHSASIQTGGDKTKVFFSTGYYKEEGMLRGNDMTRYNARLNFDQRISNTFKAGLLTQVTYTIENKRQDPLSTAASMSPFGKAYDSLGNIQLLPLSNNLTVVNPLGDELPFAFKWNEIRTNVTANAYFEFTPITGLSFRSNLGTNMSFSREGKYQDSISFSNFRKANVAYQGTAFNRFINWDNILTFTRKINDHSFTLTGIMSYVRSDQDEMYAQGIRQLLSTQGYDNLGTSEAANRTISSGYEKYNSISYAGRLNYSYKGKYLLTASLRADGVSRLAPGNKWDYFPSGGLGWNVHQEEFMSGLMFVNNFKLRATYGVAGNASVQPYGTQALVTHVSPTGGTQGGQNFGNVIAPAYWFNGVAGNPDLGWEKTASTNVGLDYAFFKSRIFGTIDVYKSKTTDILLKRSLPQSTGITYVWQNIGESENKGVEVVLSTVNVNSRDLRWTSTLTYTAASEKITSLVDGKDIIQQETNSYLLGRPINSFYTYQKLGIWQTDEAAKAATVIVGTSSFKPGDIKLADIDNNDTINAKDMTYLGSTVPKWFAGFQNTVTYKGFELSVYLLARWGQMVNAKFVGRYNPSGLGNGPANFNYWTPENPSNDFPRPRYNSNLNVYTGSQSLNFIDGSYWKIRTVTLAYTVPVNVSRKIYTEKLRIYATGNNIFTKAKHHLLKDYDPERAGDESGPITRQIVIGLNADF